MSLLASYQQGDEVSLSEGSTVDLRKPGEEEDEYSELAEEALDPDNCFPDGWCTLAYSQTHTHTLTCAHTHTHTQLYAQSYFKFSLLAACCCLFFF